MADPTLQPICPPSKRPEKLFDPATAAQGLRAAQSRITGGSRFVDVWLYHDPPAALAAPALWKLVGAPGAADVVVVGAAIEPAPTKHVALKLGGNPAPSRYRLEITPPAGVDFDPLRTWLPVRLRPECPDLGSCFDPPPEPVAPPSSPVHDYLARDWRSLRRALVEYLVREPPDADLSIADPTITALELFAHVGDVLHYRLDRVATEAYLETARLRTSVKRHARLVDFGLSDGVSARTNVLVQMQPNDGNVAVKKGQVAVDAALSPVAFTLEANRTARAALGEIPIYDWGEEACCLPAGATECVLVRPKPADALGSNWLKAGDLLVFEVVDPDDAARHRSWTHRNQDWPTDGSSPPVERFRTPLPSRPAQVVQLVDVDPFVDPLLGPGLPLARIQWRREDALTHSLPVGVDSAEGGDEVAVARGNLVPAHHGRLVRGPGALLVRPRRGNGGAPGPVEAYSLTLAGTPAHGTRAGGPGVSLRPDGLPYRLDVKVVLPSTVEVDLDGPLPTLLETEGELAAVLDVEEYEPPILRFRTGAVGLAPPLESKVSAAYEVGCGTFGNVPANALTLLEEETVAPGGTVSWPIVKTAGRPVSVRNPAPAVGGMDRTPLDVVRRDAPEAFAVNLRRAVVAADYAAEALRSGIVDRAMAQRTWSGSWPLMTTVVDLNGAADTPPDAEAELQLLLDDVRMLGTEAAVRAGTPVGLFIALEVCLSPGFDQEEARLLILQRLRPGTDESPGLFHPSRLRLGAAVYVSAVVAVVAAVPGVDAVDVREARRLTNPAGTVREVIALAPDEVAVLDDDPARPDRGRLDIQVRGGR